MKKVFISYSSLDREIANEICSFLERNNFSVWIANRDINRGAQWLSQINQSIIDCDIFFILLSESYVNSQQTLNEIRLSNKYAKYSLIFSIDIVPLTDIFQFSLAGKFRIDSSIKDYNKHLNLILEKISFDLNQKSSDNTEVDILKREVSILREQNERLLNVIDIFKNRHKVKNDCLIFISKIAEDYPYSKPLIDFLRKDGFRLFVSEEDLPDLSESDYHLEIDRKLDEAKHLIVIASKGENVINSNWVMHEWSTFFHEKMDNRKSGNIIIVTENIDTEKPKLPLSLRKETIIEMKDVNFKIIAKYLLKT